MAGLRPLACLERAEFSKLRLFPSLFTAAYQAYQQDALLGWRGLGLE